MKQRIIILFATETGTTEMVVDEILDAYEDHDDLAFEAHRMDKVDPGIFTGAGLVLLMSSSTGQGELPKNARAFHAALEANNLDLSHVRYGLVGFGDRHYAATFGGGPLTLDETMRKRGAQRLGEPCQHDKQSGTFPEEFVMDWLKDWLRSLAERK